MAGLSRIGWNLPLPHRTVLTVQHGPLLVIGFFVTLIGLERTVAVGARFMYLAPLAALLGTVALVAGAPTPLTVILLLGAFLSFAATFAALLLWARTIHHAVMFVGAVAWFVSGVLFFTTHNLAIVTPWWLIGFVLIITGERLELTRVLFAPRGPRAQPGFRLSPSVIRHWFLGAVVLLCGATLSELVWPDLGARLRGLAFLLLALWLFRFDVATRGLRQPGLHRFTAVSLFHGYFWLFVGGWLSLLFGHQRAGYLYDTQIHAITLGFVFSQVFAHAPIILPAVTRLRLAFTPAAYLAPVLLGFSLLLRIAGDLRAHGELRALGGLGNAIALASFALTTISRLRSAQHSK